MEAASAPGNPATPAISIIKGETVAGKKFRPSDWADRLLGAVACYAHDELHRAREIAGCICIVNREGFKGLAFNHRLIEIEPNLHRFLSNFARDNALVVEEIDAADWHKDRQRVVHKPVRSFA